MSPDEAKQVLNTAAIPDHQQPLFLKALQNSQGSTEIYKKLKENQIPDHQAVQEVRVIFNKSGAAGGLEDLVAKLPTGQGLEVSAHCMTGNLNRTSGTEEVKSNINREPKPGKGLLTDKERNRHTWTPDTKNGLTQLLSQIQDFACAPPVTASSSASSSASS